MAKYQCMCGWIYDEDVGEPSQNIPPGTKFEDLPDTFRCPQCGLGKNAFRKISG
ncbi:MAG TPA: rubredoxin [Methanothermococcus okinawensis]|uniref:Rubredoxin n=1 Tax=Methanothermococcus okinawensis TaxID=155863 RepID=A0A833EAM2_9EURY|nr:rubredoxin [Methanothermococcus okinawensis]